MTFVVDPSRNATSSVFALDELEGVASDTLVRSQTAPSLIRTEGDMMNEYAIDTGAGDFYCKTRIRAQALDQFVHDSPQSRKSGIRVVN